MVDVLTPTQRHLNMSRIKGRDTKPEMLVRRGLHARGLRYRLHDKSLPGSPDLVFPKYRTTVFIHGCFWHAHGCVLFKQPATRSAFWAAKLKANIQRDQKVVQVLQADGWRVLLIWECALRGRGKIALSQIVELIDNWIREGDGRALMEIRGS